VNSEMQAISADLYAQQAQAGAEGAPSTDGDESSDGDGPKDSGDGKDEAEVIDADFEMVDEEKKT